MDEAVMAAESKNCSRSGMKRFPAYAGASVLLIVLLAGAVWAMVLFSRYERQRDIDKWQLALGIMADEKAQGITSFIDRQFTILHELAANGSLQLYTQLLVERPDSKDSEQLARMDYLRNLIMAAAERSGFMDRAEGTRIKANVSFHARNYLALLADGGRIITATPGAPKPSAAVEAAIKSVLKTGSRVFAGLFLNPEGIPMAGFAVPVFGLQKRGGPQNPVAVIFGARDAADAIFPLLMSRQALTRSDEAYLCRLEGRMVRYLSPLSDGTKALKKELPAESSLAAAQAVKSPGSHGLALDYRGRRVLFTSRAMPGLPWVLVQKIDAEEALAESASHQRLLWIIFTLFAVVVVCLLSAAWWYGSTTRAKQTARALMEKSARLEAQAKLLQAINDNIRDMILLLDSNGRVVFANKSLADLLAMPASDMKGKGLASLFGPHAAATLEDIVRHSMDSGSSVTKQIQLQLDSGQRFFYAAALPLAYPDEEHMAVLLTLHDITWLKEAEEKRERLLEALVASLMRSIDLYDPYSANHSANTAVVASAVGRSMELDDRTQSTVETAARLCNIGKLSIPRDILTKTEPLTPEEEEIIRNEAFYVEEILADVPFEGPVVETIAQKNEWLDGSGYPRGLKGDEIILPARILAAANAFVAMISPRAYREALTAEEALNKMLELADRQFDRRVVAALFHVAENCLDWSSWKEGRRLRLKEDP